MVSSSRFCLGSSLIRPFKSGRLTLGYSSRLADMPLHAFRQLLKQRKIALYSYDVEDFELDLKNLQELGRL
ncbi:MAG: UPF0175 family protein [Nostoc sp. TH1S01]|nr:UPF0175 family protein [Nostoc sp. TH1S01]